jgi:NAD(P)H dehydrogenase (quinone)
MIAITDASGELGSLVIEGLLKKVPPDQVVAIVRRPERAARLVARGIRVRPEDYSSSETLGLALTGVKRLLLISGNDLSQQQHHKS